MTVALAATPASGSITSTKDFVKINVTGGVSNSGTFDANAYPTTPAIRYYLTFELSSAVLGKSYVFGTDNAGLHEFDNYVFPSAGAWTVRISNAATDASVATLSLTVA